MHVESLSSVSRDHTGQSIGALAMSPSLRSAPDGIGMKRPIELSSMVTLADLGRYSDGVDLH